MVRTQIYFTMRVTNFPHVDIFGVILLQTVDILTQTWSWYGKYEANEEIILFPRDFQP